ncbi:HlyD family efflux transporter periplasmic adaptor subunit [Pedobacter sp. JY14-1]|uniref:HlyD family secretion protein n=1 Tax=Pedobacter sp. JY14-1 TaxID=3034151 RepID=UPI0023E1C5DF|nr:HlyD family efflux transporter periplasmic adaptor subunit [Pedobacter sp. JY14-1]
MEAEKDLLDHLELRSETVRDVLSEPPRWMVRWGNAVILSAILLLLAISSFIKYPEVISAPVTVSSSMPPERLQARIDSRIEKIFVTDGQKVRAGQILLVLQSTANYQDVLKLRKALDTVAHDQLQQLPLETFSKYRLGEVQSDFNSFAKAARDEQLFNRLRPYDPEYLASAESILASQKREATLQHQKELETTKLDLIKKNYERVRQLFERKVISSAEFESEQIKYLQARQSLESLEITLAEVRQGISGLYKTRSGAAISAERDKISYTAQTRQLFEQLNRSLREWEQNYLVMASGPGTVSFQQFLTKNQFVNKGNPLLSILPAQPHALTGRMMVPAAGSGKINKGAKVLIRLDNYRYQEYGLVRARVENLSVIPDEKGSYYVDIVLPEGLKTSYNRRLPFNRELTGQADIVISDLRLIERIFNQFRSLLRYQD